MATPELRAHLRIRSEGRAIVILPDDRRISARVRDISLGGAYLMVDASDRGAPPPEGVEVEVYLHHVGHAANAVTVQGTILRVAPAGDGFVVRFTPAASEPAAALHEAVVAEAERQGIAPARLHLRRARSSAITRVLAGVTKVAALLFAYAGVRVLFGWLDAVL